MKKVILLFMGILLFGANLINVNFFEGKNKLDVLFSLDSPFKGKVKQIDKHSFVITNINSDKIIQKEFKKNFINSIIISPYNKGIKIDISSKGKIKTNVALTPDGYGVRFRIINQQLNQIASVNNVNSLSKLTQNTKTFDTASYLMALAVLVILAFILWYVKRKNKILPVHRESMKVLIQKPVDAKNKVVLFQYGEKKYLMLIGNTNVLLDVFDENAEVPKNDVQFDEMLKLSKKFDTIDKYIKNAEELKEFDERI